MRLDLSNNYSWELVSDYRLQPERPVWANSHCQCPTVLPLDERSVRVFFSCRDLGQVARIGYSDLQFGDDNTVRWTPLSSTPALSTGGIGCFDEHGVYASSIVRDGDEIKLFYAGYTRGDESPVFYASVGVAVSKNGREFKRIGQSPIMSRSEHDPCLVTSPGIYRLGNKWVMYYASGFGWFRNELCQLQSLYDLKIAWSDDLNSWRRDGEIAIPLGNGETNIARPTVLVDDAGNHHMWFCKVQRGGFYNIGYARSHNGVKWIRKDSLSGLPGNFFSDGMQAYPHVFRLHDQVLMLINDGHYGDNGFLLFRLEIK